MCPTKNQSCPAVLHFRGNSVVIRERLVLLLWIQMCGFYVNGAWVGQRDINATVFPSIISSSGALLGLCVSSKLRPLYLRPLLQTPQPNPQLTLLSLYALETGRRNEEHYIYTSKASIWDGIYFKRGSERFTVKVVVFFLEKYNISSLAFVGVEIWRRTLLSMNWTDDQD